MNTDPLATGIPIPDGMNGDAVTVVPEERTPPGKSRTNFSCDAMFLRALELPDGPARAEFLDNACGNDTGLRHRLENMLADDTAADDFFEGEGTVTASGEDFTGGEDQPLSPGEKAGDVIGRYHLIQVVGEGGFGTVWQASQEEPVSRMVALKIIKPGMDTREVLARFDQERQALAMMDHPGIARVFDAGATDSGRPYFVMELITGDPLTRFCDVRMLDTSARLRLMADICSAVQHAHHKGIIHRDLKPSNVLVTDRDGQPAAKVIDFGIAKAVTPAGEAVNSRTQAGQFIGTPAYMSPEQASHDARDIDTRSDVYSLGVLLYQLLTGTTPLESKTSRGTSIEEIRRMIRDEDPPPPSTAVGRLKKDVLAGVLKTRKTALRELSQSLRRDLDWIVMKALEKDRNRRYESASALAADIHRYLAGEPVVARPPTFSYRAGKFIRRRRGPVAAAAAVLLTLVGGLAASTTLFVREKAALGREQAETRKAETESAKNQRTADFLKEMLTALTPDEVKDADPALLRGFLDRTAARARTELKSHPDAEAFLCGAIGDAYRVIGLYPEARAQYERGMALAGEEPGTGRDMAAVMRQSLEQLPAADGTKSKPVP